MSEERTILLKLVFPDGYPSKNKLQDLLRLILFYLLGSWEYSTTFNEYISKLGTYKVEDLVKEPTRLNEEKATVHEQTQDLAVTNYKTFIETAQCSRD